MPRLTIWAPIGLAILLTTSAALDPAFGDDFKWVDDQGAAPFVANDSQFNAAMVAWNLNSQTTSPALLDDLAQPWEQSHPRGSQSVSLLGAAEISMITPPAAAKGSGEFQKRHWPA
jgi:hypothetical protein